MTKMFKKSLNKQKGEINHFNYSEKKRINQIGLNKNFFSFCMKL